MVDVAKPGPQTNPANAPARRATEARRIPMSIPRRRLEASDIPGKHLHWFLERNVSQALQGGYEFVKSDEIELNQTNVATASGVSGNADLGSNVRVVNGMNERGDTEHLVLMKINLEWWNEDQKVLEKRNNSTIEAVFRGESVGQANPGDTSQSYIPADRQPLFLRPTRKAR